MLTVESYTSIIETALENINLPQSPKGLYQPITYALQGGGKRLRPVLTLAAANAFGASVDQALNQALAVEMFHNFTLLHDDVMDNADMRRGRPSVHRRWNNNTAILSGDAMLTLSSQLLARCNPGVISPSLLMFNKTAMEVYEGQQLDMDFEKNDSITVEQYLEMIRLKTSVLLGCACALGAIAANASSQQIRAIYTYGEKLGLAFQLQDDYLDTYGDPMVFGKEIGGDIVNNKKTWLRINAALLDTSGTIDKETVSPSDDYIKIERIRQVYNRLGLPQKCRELINGLLQEAVQSLDPCELPENALDFFRNLALTTANRSH